MADRNNVIYHKGVVPRGEEFRNNLKLKGEVYSLVKQAMESSSEQAFSDLGFSKADKPAGVYANDTAWGMGTAVNYYNIKVGGKTQTTLEKHVSFGGKRMFVDVQLAFQTNSKTMTMIYKTTEASAFRGYGDSVGPMMINKKLHFDLKDMDKFKKELTEKMKEFAEKEAAYMSSTKLGVEDPVERSTASIVESISIHDVFHSSDDDFLSKLNSNENTIMNKAFSLIGEDVHPDAAPAPPEEPHTNDLLLSDKDLEEQNADAMDTVLDRSLIGNDVVITDKADEHFGQTAHVDGHTKDIAAGFTRIAYVLVFPDGQRETYLRSQLSDLDSAMANESLQNNIKEVTTAGAGAGSVGSIRYDAPLSGVIRRKPRYSETEHGKRQRMKEEKGFWGPLLREGKDGFWQVVSQDVLDGYKKNHIMGAPGAEGVEVNSEEEEEFNSGGVQKFPGGKAFDKTKLREDDADNNKKEIQHGLNAEQAKEYMKIDPTVRKRWKYDNQPTQEQVNKRWQRLSTFEEGETIKRAERVTPDKIEEPKVVRESAEIKFDRDQNIEEGDKVNGKEIIKIHKKSRLGFNMEYLVAKDDYMNESMAYIHDYLSGVQISNPNFKTNN